VQWPAWYRMWRPLVLREVIVPARDVFSTLSLIKFFKLFKTLHVSASIGHPQVLKLFVKRITVILRY
jgi:hypothetical protein